MLLRECINLMNKEFNLGFDKTNVIALWNTRILRKWTPLELKRLYYTVTAESNLVKDRVTLELLKKLRGRLVKVMTDNALKKSI